MNRKSIVTTLATAAIGLSLTIPVYAHDGDHKDDHKDKAGHMMMKDGMMMRDMMRKHMKACMTEKMAMDHETDPAKIRNNMMMQMDECMSMMPMDKGMKKGMDKDDMKQEGEKKKEHDHNH